MASATSPEKCAFSRSATNGQLHFAQRFAIDWMQLDEQGRLLHGDPADVHSYTSYDHEALAVADATVTQTLDTLDDQVPGKNPDPTTITIDNVDGNHVVLDLGGGRYAFYAHLRKGSVAVHPGDRVRRGQVLAKVGNTGNTPHRTCTFTSWTVPRSSGPRASPT